MLSGIRRNICDVSEHSLNSAHIKVHTSEADFILLMLGRHFAREKQVIVSSFNKVQ